ncbi:MAG: hypothetical protein RL398_1290 [Planctomycetota bacterium]|jgi:hypothetical protein
MSKLRKFCTELFRRKVVRVCGAYLILVWLLSQGIATLAPALGLAPWVVQTFIIGALCLTPIVAIISWRYDIVMPQLKRDQNDVSAANPAHRFASARHDPIDAGTIVVRWRIDQDVLQELTSARPIAIGREAGNEIELADPRVSRHHAVLWAEQGAWYVKDLGSANGTFLDGKQVISSQRLPARCELRLHQEGPKVTIAVAKAAATVMFLADDETGGAAARRD